MKRIAFIPIDNRPVCYTLPQQIGQINTDIELLLPDRKYLGDLKKKADIDAILNWFEKLENIDISILSLDTIAYGGLVSSRRGNESFAEVSNVLDRLKEILKKKQSRNYAFSSVMRISNNNINEEEKEYWSDYGKKIFEYSFFSHKADTTVDVQAKEKSETLKKEIPSDILEDYLCTRNRNFQVNNLYLDWFSEGLLESLVFSKDDCAEYGLNVEEANQLKEASKHNSKILVKTGADEIPLSLLSRAVSFGKEVKVAPVFTQPDFVSKISKYEDISVLESVNSQIELAGCSVSKVEDADLILYVNNFKNQQGELVMDVYEEGYKDYVDGFDTPFFIADILNANGADNCFVESIMKNGFDLEKFYGYTAWNTTGNTLGSAICLALMRKLSNKADMLAFKQVQMVRFLDDWAYQANVRKEIKQVTNEPDEVLVKDMMKKYEKVLEEKFDIDLNKVSYKFPWDRFFEIEVLIE